MLQLNVNGSTHSVDVEPEMPLLWVLRDHLNLPGTKYGCGISLCGACTVHVDGEALRSCSLPVASVVGKKIVTIEGLAPQGLHRIQEAWIEHQASWMRCKPCGARPSMVTIFLPTTLATGSEQERSASPSTCTVQAPQREIPQPYLVPGRFRWSRRTQSKGISGSTSTLCVLPFTLSCSIKLFSACRFGNGSPEY